jgi:hypothetical protein
VPTAEQVEQSYTVNVPYTEQRTATRAFQRRVPVTTHRTVTVNTGSWQTQTMEVPACCGCNDSCGCAPANRPVCRRVWVPSCEERQVPVTTYQCTTEEVPYTYNVCLNRQENRTRMCTVNKCRQERRSRTVNVCKTRQEERTRNCTVQLCRQETRTRTVPVCKYRTEERTRDC